MVYYAYCIGVGMLQYLQASNSSNTTRKHVEVLSILIVRRLLAFAGVLSETRFRRCWPLASQFIQTYEKEGRES